MRTRRSIRVTWWTLGLLLLCVAAQAQMEIGDDLTLNLNGTVGFGYGGAFGSTLPSSHSSSFSGTGNLTGFYYHPNFLSFNFQPYYNRSQNNAESQSIFDSTGLTGTVNLFSGSYFPGSLSYTRSENGSSQIGIPGIEGLTTQGSAQGFNITWSALVPKWPTLTVGFSTTGSDSSVLGTDSKSESSAKSFNLTSGYRLAGFQLNGFFNRQATTLSLPSFLSGDISELSSDSTTYGLSAVHSLPLSGTFGASWSRSNFGREQAAGGDGISNNLNATATINPTRKLTITGDVRYISNLVGVLRQDVLAGSEAPLLEEDSESRSVSFGSFATYALGHGFGLRGHITHRRQFYFGKHVSDTLYGGTLTYSYARPLLGLLYFSFGMVDTANDTGNNSLGFTGNVGLNRKFGNWDTTANFSYSQRAQTLLALYTTSSYSYGGSVRRRLNWETYWHGSFRSTHSALTQRDGDGNRSHNITTGLTWRRYGLTAGYAYSTGTTVLTASGLLTPVPETGFLADNILLFNGRSYSLSAYMSPVRRMTLTGSYINARSDTTSQTLFSLNETERYNARLEYRVRQLTLIGGFTRDRQAISSSGAPPSMVNSYSIGIYRWFNIF